MCVCVCVCVCVLVGVCRRLYLDKYGDGREVFKGHSSAKGKRAGVQKNDLKMCCSSSFTLCSAAELLIELI